MPALGPLAGRRLTMRTRILVIIACAFIATTLAFLGASIASFFIASDIDKATAELLTNALPSVRELTRARTALRELRTSAADALAARPPREEGKVDAHWRELDGALTAETGTPWYEGERTLYESQVRPALEDLGDAVQDFERLSKVPKGDPRLVRGEARLEAAADRADAAVESLSDMNHEQAFAAAERIVRTRKDATRATLYLDIGSTVIALVAALLAIELTRHFARVMRRNVALEAERAQELDLVAQRVAHDLMSPLAAVSLSLGSVQRKHTDEETTRAVQRALRVLERSRRMVQGIYAFARSSAEPTGEAVTPLRAAVLDAVGALQAIEGEGGPTVDVQDFQEVDVRMDRGLLDVVLSNLLSNASKYTANAPVRRITVRGGVEPRRVHVEVEDTGPGVPDGLADAIFEPYKRAPGARQPGLGLGLATVKRLVHGHGGAVGVRNAPSGGAIFWFELPRAPQRAPAAEAAATGRPPRADALHPRPSG
jgi:signal transduction histidine kinase